MVSQTSVVEVPATGLDADEIVDCFVAVLLDGDCLCDRFAAGLDVDHEIHIADLEHSAVDRHQDYAEGFRRLSGQFGDVVCDFAEVVVFYFVVGLFHGIGYV